MRTLRLIVILSLIGLNASIGIARVVSSPDGKVQADLYTNDAGRLCLRLVRGSTPILDESPLGITVNGTDFGNGVQITSIEHEAIQETYPWRGVHAVAVNNCNSAVASVSHSASKLQYTVELRVFNDGIGYRHVIPGTEERTVQGESSSWNVVAGSQVWFHSKTGNYEGYYTRQKPEQIPAGTVMAFPIVVELADGTLAAFTEAGLLAYSGMTLKASGTTLLSAVFEDDAEGWKETGEFRTPWRVTMTGPDLNSLVNSDIVHNLCPPPDATMFPQGFSTPWIRSGRALWNWWSDSSLDQAQQKEWVDKTAELGFEFYLVDAGWEKAWELPEKNKWAALKELCEYAKGKNVGIHVWKHWSGIEKQEQREEFFRLCAEAGAVGIKIDFMDSESRQRIRFYTQTLIDAAEYKLMINFHGANKPTGEPRTYPNEMTREGILGLEYNKWSDIPPSHYATVPFTRYLAGHGDFTPCTFTPEKLKGTTAALQLASTIVFTSPLMHWADHWRFYVGSPVVEVIKQIPTVWDETLVLPGSKLGELAAFARRSGDKWFIGILNGGGKTQYNLILAFLPKPQYDAILVSDVAGKSAEMAVDRIVLDKGAPRAINLEAGGGFVAILTPKP
ncbi:MAG: glycoside hydrolase family 97 protein [Phycisphaerae bacterium]|nr:glycoside hydrolase family 97 protein [Phycisphaerae bacterium]